MIKYQKLITNGIKTFRQKQHLTQEKFAELTGMSIQGLSNIERNRYQPSAETIDKICTTFNITPLQLLTQEHTDNDKLIEEISTLLKSCTHKKLKQIYDIISILIK